jgi:hypothetical protein
MDHRVHLCSAKHTSPAEEDIIELIRAEAPTESGPFWANLNQSRTKRVSKKALVEVLAAEDLRWVLDQIPESMSVRLEVSKSI